MAEEVACTSVEFEEGGITSSYTSCWSYTVPDARWSAANTEGALPRSYLDGSRSWRTCKYFVKGMPAVCGHFDGTAQLCKQPQNAAGTADGKSVPSGYNQGFCDSLGRQTSCNRYSAGGEDNLNQYICVLPNMFLSGIGKRVLTEDPPIVRAVRIDEIAGYNNDGTGVGQCDCYGMGRGAPGCAEFGGVQPLTGSKDAEVTLSKLPVVCNFYRPFAMGFGAIAPHEARRSDGSVDVERLTEMVEKDEPLDYRLPFSFEVFNLRARFQKCLWYEAESGGDFQITNQGLITLDNDEAFDGAGKLINCKCTDPQSSSFNTKAEDDSPTMSGVKTVMANVWAKAGTVVCNGAKPECPCYTGKWYYCTDEKMWDGMPVTAQQIMELRFWSYEWSSQEEYDKYYSERPNPDDTLRPEIYTFTKWKQIADDPEFSQMEGKKVSMCQPAPLQLKEFIPDKYLTVTPIVFENVGTNTNTQFSFPNLIKDPRFPNIKPLTVTYPYASEEAFDEAICIPSTNKTPHRKKTNEVYADSIYTVGQTVINRQVYVINMTGVGRVPRIVSENANSLTMAPEQKSILTADLTSYISNIEEYHNQYLRTGYSDSKGGVFVIDPIKLQFGSNQLLIVADFGGGEFGFKKREVISLWCGGVASQTVYDYGTSDDASSETKQPTLIDPPADIEANILKLGGSKSVEAFPARSIWVPNLVFGDKTYYSYSMYWEEIEEEVVSKLCSVGNSTYIWCEIDNLDINYLFDFEITEAKAEYTIKVKTEEEEDEVITIELEQVNLDYRFIPPNACLFKPKASAFRFRCLPSKCKVILSYKYQKFIHGPIPAGKTGIFGGGLDYYHIYRDASFSYSLEDTSLKISGVSSETVGFMFFFKDEYGRAISAVATKFMPYIIRPSCRNVEIRYIYKADGKQYVLEPEHSAFCTDIAGNRLTGKIITHMSDPVCCDHLCSSSGRGPMWFPYNRCEQYDFYDVFIFANSCAAPIDVGPQNAGLICSKCGIGGSARRLDHRYRGPDEYQATAVVRGNWAAACNCGWKYYFSDASSASVQFSGYGNIKGKVDETYYEENGWRLPPFGNDGRELVERYLSSDYIYYYDLQDPSIVRREWVPFVMDSTAFHLKFDAFTTYDTTYDIDFSGSLGFPGHDNFKHVNQLNFMTHDRTGEVIDYDNRQRFDEVFKSHIEGNCTYPPPVLAAGTTTSVSFYQFNNDNTLWAWQEFWKEVERNIAGGGVITEKFNFISEYERPPYVWSLFKEEVKLICDEGEHEIVYTGPIVATDGELPGEIETYPSISLDSAYPKYFEILYGSPTDGIWHYDANNYGDESVEWKREGGKGKAEGSSEEDNIYEDRFGDDWVFSQDERFKNILFDNSGEQDFYYKQDQFSNEYIKLKYCGGLMVRIPRNRLIYLPKDKIDETISITDNTAGSTSFSFTVSEQAELTGTQSSIGGYTWAGNANFSCGEAAGKVISKVTIRGQYGRIFQDMEVTDISGNTTTRNVELVYVKPGFTMDGTTLDGEINYSPRGLPSTSANNVLPTSRTQKATKMYNYELVYKFPLSPIEMLKKGYASFNFNLLAEHGTYYINISEILIETATYKDVAQENIKVWERKYLTSTGNVDWKNVDGPEELLHFKRGGGVHFKFDSYPTEIIKTQNKMRGVFADVPYKGIDEDESITITYDNLFTMEAEEQQRLYKKSLSLDMDAANIVYRSICPPPLSTFFTQTLRTASFVGFGSCLFILSNAEWGKLKLVKDLLQTEFWRTGGHFYKWSSWFTFQSCMVGWTNSLAAAVMGLPQGLFATDFERTFEGEFKHPGHAGIGNPLAGPEQSIDPGNSYYSLRFYHERARFERYETMTGQSPDGGFDVVSKANPYNVSR